MRRSISAAIAAAVTAAGLAAVPAAQARDDTITSFDGTSIALHFFPTDKPIKGGKSPTVLFGPGWSSSGDTDENSASDPTVGSVGVGPLRAAGFNVLTWDPRGFGKSGGTVTVDSPDAEGRDVQALIDYVAKQPEAQLDGPNDPRLGMSGASYGGGIQLVTAAIDNRVDAIVPDIAWHSLGTSLYKDDTFKGGWSNLLYLLGQANGRLDPHIGASYQEGVTTGHLSDENKNWFLSRGPGDLVKKVKIPTLFVQGTVDTLFTLQEAITNYEIVKANGVPTKMLWFCGGHGACLTDPGDVNRIENATVAWLQRYLTGDSTIGTGAGFDWIDQNGTDFSTASYPPAAGAPIAATGSGTLPLITTGGSGPSSPGPGAVGALAGPTNGSRATNAVNVNIDAPAAGAQLLGAPQLKLTYSGTGSTADTRVYAQIVDETTGTVVGNQVTPIPIVADGAEHTIERPMEVIAEDFPAGAKLTLQLTSSATAYDTQRSSGSVDFKSIGLSLPTVKKGAATMGPSAPNVTVPQPTVRIGLTRPRGVHRDRHGHRYLIAKVRASGGPLTKVRFVLTKGRKTIAQSRVFTVKAQQRRSATLKLAARPALRGNYVLKVSGTTPAGKVISRSLKIKFVGRGQ
jgi:ABC-2 type transport system ATP-binding protein